MIYSQQKLWKLPVNELWVFTVHFHSYQSSEVFTISHNSKIPSICNEKTGGYEPYVKTQKNIPSYQINDTSSLGCWGFFFGLGFFCLIDFFLMLPWSTVILELPTTQNYSEHPQQN